MIAEFPIREALLQNSSRQNINLTTYAPQIHKTQPNRQFWGAVEL